MVLIYGKEIISIPNQREVKKIYKESMSQKIDNLQLTNKYDLEIDKIYMDEGINNIVSDPVKYLKLYFVKMFSFLFVDLNSSLSQLL